MVRSQRPSSSVRAARITASLVVAASLVLSLAACAPSSASSGGSGSNGGGSSAATATFSGSESGTVVMNLCDSSGSDSIFVTVKGDTDQLPGVVSASTMDFTGKDSLYSIDSSGAKPQFSADGNTVTLDGVVLKSVIDSTKKLTFSGKITCP